MSAWRQTAREKYEYRNRCHTPPPLRGGGTTWISLFEYFDFKNPPYVHFTPKWPHFGLKTIISFRTLKIQKQILTPNYLFRGIPKVPKKFFRKLFYKTWNSSFIFQYFSKNPKICVKRLVWANNVGSRFLIFCRFIFFEGQKVKPCSMISLFVPQKI